MNTEQYEVLMFDLGGVIIDLDFEACFQAFKRLGLKKDIQKEPFLEEFEMGLIEEATFRELIRNFTQLEVTDQEIDEAWNSLLLEIPSQRLELLLSNKKRYQVYVLSNTNSIHARQFKNIMKSTSGTRDLHHYAHKVYFSHEIKLRKPDKAIYEYVLQENNVSPEKVLFFDDKPENLVGATSVGINTFHVTHPDRLFDLFAG